MEAWCEMIEDVRIATLKTMDALNGFRQNFKPATEQIFNNEKEFQLWLARELVKLGFEVYSDRNISEDILTFHGDQERPDLLVFFNNNYKESKVMKISSPIGIELKFNGGENKFANISNSVLQVKKYFGKEYYTDKWRGNITNLFLSTDELLQKDKIYYWMPADHYSRDEKSFQNGMRWTIVRFLSTICNQAGLLCFDGEHFVLETPNSLFFLLSGGDIGYKPNNWNNNGKGY